MIRSDEDTAGRRWIDVGGRRIAIDEAGAGAPTVILETGLGAESAEWRPVQDALARITRVFRYDRAGRGDSDPAPAPRTALCRPRTALDMVDELRAVLRLAQVPGPYILVGHSYGGLLMRLFAKHHREEVAGLVLVDSMHEDQFDAFGPLFPPPSAGEPQALSEMRAFWTEGWRDPASTVERIDLVESGRQGRRVGDLGDLPMRVLVAGAYLTAPMVPPPARARLQALWASLQARLAGLSTNAQTVRLDASGHFIQRDDPQAIVTAVRAVLDEVRGAAASHHSRNMVTPT